MKWPKVKRQKDKQSSTKHYIGNWILNNTNILKTGVNSGAPEG
jgi:hypothetical protein